MLSFIIRRLLYTPLVVLGVLLITFLLFNVVQGDISQQIAGRNASPETVAEIRAERGWDKPLMINTDGMKESGFLGLFDSQFFNHVWNTVRFDFGRTNESRELIWDKIRQGIKPSLSITLPMFAGTLLKKKKE